MSKSEYTFAGVSTKDGVQGLRFANSGKQRVKVLERNGHTDVRLEEMPIRGDTAEALHFLLGEDWACTLPCVLAAAKEAGFLQLGVEVAAQEEVAAEA